MVAESPKSFNIFEINMLLYRKSKALQYELAIVLKIDYYKVFTKLYQNLKNVLNLELFCDNIYQLS